MVWQAVPGAGGGPGGITHARLQYGRRPRPVPQAFNVRIHVLPPRGGEELAVGPAGVVDGGGVGEAPRPLPGEGAEARRRGGAVHASRRKVVGW